MWRHRNKVLVAIPINAVWLDHVKTKLVWALDLKTGRLSRLLADAVGVTSVVPLLPNFLPLTKEEAAKGIFFHCRWSWCGLNCCLLRFFDPLLHAERLL